jgi:hypothetical protein
MSRRPAARSAVLAVLAVVLAVLIAACGGSAQPDPARATQDSGSITASADVRDN